MQVDQVVVMRVGRLLVARTAIADSFLAFEIWLVTAGMYLMITILLSLVASALERHYHLNHQR